MAKLVIVLTAISLVAGLAVAVTYSRTAATIVAQQKAVEIEAVKAVLPAGAEIIERTGSGSLPAVFWEARKNDSTVAYAFRDSSRGYATNIRILAGCDPHGVILGLCILSQNETPGLGTRMLETISSKVFWNGLFAKSEDARPWFCRMFEGISTAREITIEKAPEWHARTAEDRAQLAAKNAVTAITGATISTRAVATALRRSIPSYIRQLASQERAQP